MEIWKDIDGYDGRYQISNFGKVRSFSKWKNGEEMVLTKCGNPGPYSFVNLSKCGKIKAFYVHKLVAQYFVENPNGYNEVNHIDGNTQNNNANNLEWCTHLQNMQHASRTGILSKAHDSEKGKRHPRSKPVIQTTKDGVFVKEWESVNQIMRETGIKADRIFRCCNPRKYPHEKSAAGYKWRYKNEESV